MSAPCVGVLEAVQTMTEEVESSSQSSFAWRLLATLEGGSLLLAATALLAYTARNRVVRRKRSRTVKSVLLTNTENPLGSEIKTQLESRGCEVRDLSQVTRGATSGAGAGGSVACVDALVVVGAEVRPGIEGISGVVSEDVYNNLKSLESLSVLVRRGGTLSWACSGEALGSFGAASAAFDHLIHTTLEQVARSRRCKVVWVGRGPDTAGKLVESLVPCTTEGNHRFSIRNAAKKASIYVGRWLKIIT